MRGVGIWLVVCLGPALASCGKSGSENDGQGASGGASPGGTTSAGGTGGTTTEPRAGSGGSGKGGAGGSEAGTAGGGLGGEAGEASVAEGGTPGESGGSGGGGAGKAGSAGHAGNTPATYFPPKNGDTWQYESADPLNATPPVLAPIDDGVLIAGATADPATAGLTAFDDGIESEAFVARLDPDGKAVWSTPLKPASLPWAVARAGDDTVVVAPYLPDLTQVSTSYVSKDIYLAKLGPSGAPVYEKTLTFEHESTFTYGLAVAPSGDIFLAGGYQDADPGEHVILVKCDASGTKLWEKAFPHGGTQGFANAAAVLANGDVVITGAFDLELDFGGDTDALVSTATLSGIPNGFVARFTPDGAPVWAAHFGGDDFSDGTSLASLPDGDFILGGAAALNLELGGLSREGAPFTPTDTQPFPPTAAFIARLSGAGAASWLNLELDSDFGKVVAYDGRHALLGGQVDTLDTALDGTVYLRAYDAATGSAKQLFGATGGDDIESTSLVTSGGALWVSGRFATGANFGNSSTYSAEGAGVFLLRLEPVE